MLTQTFASLRTFTGILCLCLMTVCCVSFASAEQLPWKIGLAAVDITPDEPVWMAGYASRNKPSEGVLARIHAKAIAFQDAEGHKALLLTADVIGYRREVADLIRATITERTGLERSEILLNPSHTHAGPVLGLPDATGYGLADEHASRVHAYTRQLAVKLADVAAAALDKLEPAQLSYARGVANFVMNRREFTERGIRLGVNPSGYADRAVPVLAVRSADGQLRAVLFGCACHNTTLGGNHYEICGDYAGFAQAHVERELAGVQAMFMIGCGADANPYPRGTVEHARRHGDELGSEVCRVVGGQMQPIGGPLRTCLEFADLPLAQPAREELEQMAKGPGYLRYNATRMLDALANNRPLLTEYRAPVAVWQFGDDLTVVGLAGEVVSEFVPLLHSAVGHRRLWIAGYCNDDFGYIPTAKILAEGGYETRCLIPEPGFFAPEAQDVLVEKVRQLAAAAGRKLGD